jgi:hypothetical protein
LKGEFVMRALRFLVVGLVLTAATAVPALAVQVRPHYSVDIQAVYDHNGNPSLVAKLLTEWWARDAALEHLRAAQYERLHTGGQRISATDPGAHEVGNGVRGERRLQRRHIHRNQRRLGGAASRDATAHPEG